MKRSTIKARTVLLCLGVVLGFLLSCGAVASADSIFRIGGNAPFSSFSSIAAGLHGEMWVSQDAPLNTATGAHYAIGRVDLADHYRLYRTSAETNGIAVNRSGTVFATERAANRIAIVSPAGVVREVRVPTRGSESNSIVAGPDGNGWFVEEEGNRIGRVTPSGAITEFPIPQVPDWETGIPLPAEPTGIAVGRDGRMWFGIDNGVATITTAGAIVEHTWSLKAPAGPESITAAADGSLWMTDAEQHVLYHVAPDGSPTVVPMPVTTPALLTDRGGALSVFDTADPFRWQIRPGRQPTRQRLALTLKNGDRETATASGLQPVALGPAGTVWIAADMVDAGTHSGDLAGIVVVNDGGRCIVPDLSWDTLFWARRELAQHGCRLGKVRMHNTIGIPIGDLVVGPQSSPAGTVLRPGAAVSVTLTIR